MGPGGIPLGTPKLKFIAEILRTSDLSPEHVAAAE